MSMRFDQQGHRGCRALMPENTIPAMLHALDLGVTTLEMDVVITKDNQVILSHEPFFNHEITTRPDGITINEKEERSLNIYQMLYDEVKQFDVGLKPHPRFPEQQKFSVSKPLLKDVIDSVESYCSRHRLSPVFYNIETKTQPHTDSIYHPVPKEFVDLLMNVITSRGIEKKVIIQSFDMRTLQYLHVKYPATQTSLLIEEGDIKSFDEQIKILGFIPSVYSPHFSLVSKILVKQCHEKKIKLVPWTVNDLFKMKELKKEGIDGIITDDPRLFKQLTQ